MIDLHSHILPGIDDGATSLDDSVEIVKELVQQGITKIIATPHFIDETIYTSKKDKNLELVRKLKRALKQEKIKADIYLGNEIYINTQIDELLQAGEISSLAGGKYLLVELPMSGEYPNYEDILIGLMQNGYQIVLAHPERYAAMQDNFDILEELWDEGVLLQCNLGSIVGQYGKRAKKTIQEMAKRKMIFGFGSDIHHCKNKWDLSTVKQKLKKYYSEDEIRKLLVDNPQKILNSRRRK